MGSRWYTKKFITALVRSLEGEPPASQEIVLKEIERMEKEKMGEKEGKAKRLSNKSRSNNYEAHGGNRTSRNSPLPLEQEVEKLKISPEEPEALLESSSQAEETREEAYRNMTVLWMVCKAEEIMVAPHLAEGATKKFKKFPLDIYEGKFPEWHTLLKTVRDDRKKSFKAEREAIKRKMEESSTEEPVLTKRAF